MSTTKSKADSSQKDEQYQQKQPQNYFTLHQILQQCEKNPRYQNQVLYVLALINMIFCFFIMGLPFLFATPNFLCTNKDTESTDERKICVEPQACQTDDYTSITSDYHWVCDQRYMVGYWVWSLFIGIFIGFFLNLNFVSYFGRKSTITFFVGLSGIAYILAGLSENQELLFLYLFLGGFGFMQFSLTMSIYLNEIIVNESYQQFSFITISIIWALGQIAINYISYFVTNWRYILIFCTGLPLIICLILIAKLIRESPYFLISQQKFMDARKAITYIQKYNNIQIKGKLLLEGETKYLEQFGFISFCFQSNLRYNLPEEDLKAMQEQSDKILNNQIERENYSILDLLRPLYQRLTLLLLLLWIYQQLSYYASIYSVGFYGRDVHTNYLAISIAEVLACFIGSPLKNVKKTKYKWILLILMIIAMLAQLFMYYRPVPYQCFYSEIKCNEEKLIVIAATINKFVICLYGIILRFYTQESYPYFLSGSSQYLTPIGGSIVGLFLPFVIATCSKTLYNPLGTIGWYGIGAVLLTFFLDDLSNTGDNFLVSTKRNEQFYRSNEEMHELQESQILSGKDQKDVPLITYDKQFE